MSVSDEAVEKAARAGYERVWRRDWSHASREDREYWLAIADALIVAALPVIERDLRETIADGLETIALHDGRNAMERSFGMLLVAAVREGGRT